MSGRFELTTIFDKLPIFLKRDYPDCFKSKYEAHSIIRPTDPVLVIKNDSNIKTTLYVLGFYFTLDKRTI